VTTTITTIVLTTIISKVKGVIIPISIPIRGLQLSPIGIPLDKTFKGYKTSPPTIITITILTVTSTTTIDAIQILRRRTMTPIITAEGMDTSQGIALSRKQELIRLKRSEMMRNIMNIIKN